MGIKFRKVLNGNKVYLMKKSFNSRKAWGLNSQLH